MHHLGIETDDLDALVARMKANGHEFRNTVREEAHMIQRPDDY
jgi:hypothetical protein